MNATDKVLQLVRQSGPLIPSQISKEIGTDILLASAMLSDLASQNKVRISSVKVGGSPLYYTDGQEGKLQEYVDKLPQMEQRAFHLLKENKVIRDGNSEPAIRYALRQIKDFAKPLEVTANGVREIYWKWYLLPTKDAEPFIKREIASPKKEEARPEKPVQEAIKPVEEVIRKEIKPVSIEKAAPVERKEPEVKAPKPEVMQQPEKKIVQKEKPERPRKQPKKSAPDEFLEKIGDFFTKNNIEVVEQKFRKKGEADYVIKVPSAVGFIQYYCRAKNKKSCSDSDLSEAIVQGQIRKLPALFLSSGDLTRQGQALLENDAVNISFRKV